MASRITMRPVPHPLGFRDAAPHSADLNPIYIQYLAVDDDAEDAELVWRPLFGTAVVLELGLSENGLPKTVVMTSASSKTALGLAHLLRSRPVRVVAMTSPARRAWVGGAGFGEHGGELEDGAGRREGGEEGEHERRREHAPHPVLYLTTLASRWMAAKAMSWHRTAQPTSHAVSGARASEAM
jgi:hypothetical protein